MLGQSAFSRGSSATAGNRLFVYEVTGLQQNEVTTQCEHQIRSSSSTFLQVPLNRMNETMQRIVNLGGKIVSIRPINQGDATPAAAKQAQASE
jgi:phycocyanin-associated, rod